MTFSNQRKIFIRGAHTLKPQALMVPLLLLLTACVNPPGIYSIYPTSGPAAGGTRITIYGQNFAKNARVTVDDSHSCQSVTYLSTALLECVVPAASYPSFRHSVSIKVENPDHQYHSDTLDSAFTYEPTPGATQTFQLNPGVRFEPAVPQPTSLAQRMNARETRPVAHAQVWGQAETAMNDESAVAAVQSINRLDQRYPEVLNQSGRQVRPALDQVRAMVQESAAPTTLDRHKKSAALRFLERVRIDFTHERNSHNLVYPYPLAPNLRDGRSNLSIQELIALTWRGATDRRLFQTEADLSSRKRSLVDAFATIQRAHNDHGNHGAIIWDENLEPDLPSCYQGTYKRILESLNHHHPDVVGINTDESAAVAASLAASERNAAAPLALGRAASPSNGDISRDIRAVNQALFPHFVNGLTTERQAQLRAIIEAYNPVQMEASADYRNYLQQLRTRVRETSPMISLEAIEAQTNPDAMLAFLSEALD